MSTLSRAAARIPSRTSAKAAARLAQWLTPLVLATVLLPSGAALADPLYAVTAVAGAGSTASGINGAGAVVGQSAGHGFLYSTGGFVDLGTLGGAGSAANAINDSGAVVGWADNGAGQSHAFLYAGGSMLDLGTLGGAGSVAWSINNAGMVVGSASNGQEPDPYYQQAFSYSGSSLQSLGALQGGLGSDAYAVNGHGLAAGSSYQGPLTVPEYPRHATAFGNGAVTEVAQLDNSVVYGINDTGAMVGRSGFFFGTRAFMVAGGVVTDIGVLDETLGASEAYDINNLGQVVGAAGVSLSESSWGYHGFLYGSDGALVDLNSLIDPASGWEIVDARGINDAGQIAGLACKGGECFAVRLDLISSVPEPGSWAMLGGGLLWFGMRRRRSA